MLPRNSKLVYSTAGDNTCPRCGKALQKCQCDQQRRQPAHNDGIIRIQRQTKGRGGKEVTVASGFALKPEALKALAKRLKTSCGSGGSIKDNTVEIQGDHRQTLQKLLEKDGFTVRLSGG